jgi:hypothetical protein
MAISRPFLLALLGAALLGATLFAVQNARDNSADDAAPAAQQSAPEQQAAQPAEPAPASEPAGLTAEDALAAAFAGDQKVESGRFSIRLSAQDFEGVPQLDGASIEVGGRFQGQGTKEMPKFDIDIDIAAPGERLRVGAISLGDEGFLTHGEEAYAVPDSVMGTIADARTEIAGFASEPQPKLSVGGFDVGGWVTDPKVVGTETMDGVEVTHVAGKLDPSRFVDGLSQLGPGSNLPEGDYLDGIAKNKAMLERVIGEPKVDVYVGEDRVLRRLAVAADLNLAAAGEGAGGARDGKVLLDVRLSEVNEPQTIASPGAPRDVPLQQAFERVEAINAANMMGVGALMVQQPGLAAARANDFDFSELTGGSAPLTDNPQRAARAIKAGKKVVLLFHNPDGLDDRAMRRVVNELDGRTQAAVFIDHVDAVDRYGKLVEDLGVSQTPAVVLIDRAGEARLIEGYADTETLAQAVADAR